MLRHPISAEEIDYAQSKMARARKQMLAELVKKDYIAFRRGMLSFDGWQITKDGVDRLMREAASSPPNPVIPDSVSSPPNGDELTRPKGVL